MVIAQKLYEAGKITCLRSDAVMVAPEAQVAARRWLTAAFGEGAVPAEPPRYESKEGSQEAHEAIRPTDPAAGGLVAREGEAVGREEGGVREGGVREGGVREGRCRPAAASRVAGRAAGRSNAGRCPAAMCSCVRRGPRAGAWRSRPGGVRRAGAAAGPDRRLGAVEPGGSTFALGACGWRREMRHFLEIFKQVQTAPLWCIFRPSGY